MSDVTVDRTELRGLHAAATPGKWFVVGLPWNQGKPYIVAGTEDPHAASFVCDLDDVTAEDERLTLDADAALIVAAVNALPVLLDRLDAYQERLERALFLAEHLHAMVPQSVWRDSGGDDMQGHYEGDYHAENVAEELRAARAALDTEQT